MEHKMHGAKTGARKAGRASAQSKHALSQTSRTLCKRASVSEMSIEDNTWITSTQSVIQ